MQLFNELKGTHMQEINVQKVQVHCFNFRTYTEGYHYKDEYSYSETLFRSGLLEKGKILEELNRGTFHQHAAKIDDIQDPDVSYCHYSSCPVSTFSCTFTKSFKLM